jgi:hypothetical protein
MSARVALGLACALVIEAVVRPARAEPTAADRSTAQALFDEAGKLAAAQRWAEACPKLAESQRLDPAMGTQFYLAKCLERVGRLATAWAHYLAVADAARAAGLADRDRYARARADALRPRLPRLTVKVTADAADLEITRDGAPFARTQWAAGIPVDPGEHVVVASARGKQSWTTKVSVAEATVFEVIVPALEDAPDAVHGPSVGTLRIAGLSVGAAGLLGLTIGAGSGAWAINKKAASNAGGHCDAANTCDPIGLGLRRESLRAASVSTAAFAVGAVAAAGGAVLYLIAPKVAPRPDSNVGLVVGAGSLSIVGRW